MKYECPVCEVPQADAEHLAHHLAFTAMLHSDDHETWLDNRVEDWADSQPQELAMNVTEYVDEVDDDSEFEEMARNQQPTDSSHHHRPAVQDFPSRPSSLERHEQLDDEAASIMNDAREMTESMLETGGNDGKQLEDEAVESEKTETEGKEDR